MFGGGLKVAELTKGWGGGGEGGGELKQGAAGDAPGVL